MDGAADGLRLGPGRRRRAAVPSPPGRGVPPRRLGQASPSIRVKGRARRVVLRFVRRVADRFVLGARAVRLRVARLVLEGGLPLLRLAAAGPRFLFVVLTRLAVRRLLLRHCHQRRLFPRRRRRRFLLPLIRPPTGPGPAGRRRRRRGRVPGRVHRTRVVGARARQSHPHAGGVTPLLRRDVPGPAPPPGVGGRRLTLLLHLL
mmetsp:Transcript_15454/g.35357  ORF Transcript_15454/g.35357 Transcript_15454/m.35357 type:complete len:203 (+) Transcript_15454:1304-1912(+)